jgi:signal transduction histidine kinase
MLVVVLAGVAVASLTGAWMGAHFARQQEQENLRRLAGSLADAGFPLSENVLHKMAGLSGADFVVVAPNGQVVQSTIRMSDDEIAELRQLDQSARTNEPRPDFMLTLSARRYRSARLPVRVAPPHSEPQSLYVLYPEEHWDRVARRAAWPPLVAGIVAALIAVALTTLLARRFTARVRQLSEQAAAVADGRFLAPPLPKTDDELRDLATSLNRMSEQLGRYEEQVRRSERMRTLGQLGAGIAHQLRNSATGALLALEFHSADLTPDTDRESLDVALRQLHLMEASLKRFLRLGRGEQVPSQIVSLSRLIDETLPLVEPVCRHARIQLRWNRPDAEVCIDGEPDSLQQLLLNLIMNAIDAATIVTGAPGEVRVEVVNQIANNGPNAVRLRVLDSGPGPDARMATNLFEPFATSKPDGTGLGLSVAREIAQSHSASLNWHRVDGMTCFEVWFNQEYREK